VAKSHQEKGSWGGKGESEGRNGKSPEGISRVPSPQPMGGRPLKARKANVEKKGRFWSGGAWIECQKKAITKMGKTLDLGAKRSLVEKKEKGSNAKERL